MALALQSDRAAGAAFSSGSYFENYFISPLTEMVFSTATGAVRGAWRGLSGRRLYRLFDLEGAVTGLIPGQNGYGLIGTVVTSPFRITGTGLELVAQGLSGVAGRAVRGTAKVGLAAGVGLGAVALRTAVAAPTIAVGAAAETVKIGAGAAEAALRVGRAIWHNPLLMERTPHWSGKLGLKQWTLPAESAIIGGGLAFGLVKGGLAAFNTHRLGWVDVGQLQGTITPAQSTATGTPDPAWYDADSDGSLVFALNRLRNR